MEPKFCINCNLIKKKENPHLQLYCTHVSAANLVTGEPQKCYEQREKSGSCGTQGLNFVS